MAQANVMFGMNLAMNSGASTAAGAATTFTVVTAVNVMIRGKFTTQVSASAKTLVFVTTAGVAASDAIGFVVTAAPVLYGGASTNALAPSGNSGQALILVHCAYSDGLVKTFWKRSVQLDATGAFLGSATQFPGIPDTVTPFAYQILVAGLTAGDITVGTSNWNATGFTNTVVNVGVLPSRPPATVTG